MKSALTLLFSCVGLLAQQASVEGLTVNSITRQPIPGVHVRLLATTYNGVTAAYGAISDREGRFSIATVRPGVYLLAPERAGFLSAGSGPTPPSLTLRPGQQLTDYRIELTPRAILSGRVVNENGDPVPDVNLRLTRADNADQPDYFSRPPDSPTDDHGEFRLTAAPGRYHLQALAPGGIRSIVNDSAEHRGDLTLPPYRHTFYHSTTAKTRATPIEAVGGRETSGIEIRLTRQAGVAISGIVRGIPDPTAGAGVLIQWGPTPQSTSSNNGARTDRDGRFTFPDAQPGYYRVFASYYQKPQMISRVAEFQVSDANVTNLELTLVAGADVSGSVEMEGDAPDAPLHTTVRLEGSSFFPVRPNPAEIDERKAFGITGVPPLKYRVRVSPLPDNAYVKRVVVDGTESPDATADLTSAPRSASIKIILARDAAQLSGRVLDQKGERPLTTAGIVVLSPDPLPETLDLELLSRMQPDGSYSFKTLRPGKYRIAVFDPLHQPGGAAAIRTTLEKGETLELVPNTRTQKDLRLPSTEDANARPRQ